MYLSQQVGDIEAIDTSQEHPLQKLYPVIVQEFYETNKIKTGSRYFSGLWGSMAPDGNIYRLMAMRAECRTHSADLQKQLRDLADAHKTLLGGEALTTEQRAEKLLELLKDAEVTAKCKDMDKVSKGFPPLEEFLAVKVKTVGWIVFPGNWEGFKGWFRISALAWCMFFVQVLAPITVFVNRWSMDTNSLKDPEKMWSSLTLDEITCLGTTFNETSTTLVGTLLLFLVVFIVRSYAVQEQQEAMKSGVLPVADFWICVGIVANSVACLALCLALPFLFWSEDSVTSLLLDSMSLTFLFSLDDLSGGLCSDVEDNAQFQRSCAWQAILLSQCPVRVGDLINPHARRAKDLWDISFDASGSLVVADGAKPGAKKSEICETRFHYVAADRSEVAEEAPLLEKKKKLVYRTSETSRCTDLPTLRTTLVMLWWRSITWALMLWQIVASPMFFIFNEPCGLQDGVGTTAAAVVLSTTATPGGATTPR